jgi:hypothetical protein
MPLAVARVALVKPDKARNVENMILTAAKRGALQSKVGEYKEQRHPGSTALVELLVLVYAPTAVRSHVHFVQQPTFHVTIASLLLSRTALVFSCIGAAGH